MNIRALLARHWPVRRYPEQRGAEISVVVRFDEPSNFVEPLDWRQQITAWNDGHLGATS